MIASKQSPTTAAVPPDLVASATVQQQTVAAANTPITTVSEVCTPQTMPAHHPPLTVSSVSVVSLSALTTPTATTTTATSQPHRLPSPATHQQFTVHGHFAGPDDHVGPAPNVTVNPFYQPNVGESVAHHPSKLVPAQNTQDQQIRVLTPSEIMRTLPSLCQENYEPPTHALVRHCVLRNSQHVCFVVAQIGI